MSNEFLSLRRNALEESFFANHNEKLRDKLQEQEQAKARKTALSEATGIENDQLLETLAALDIHCQTLVALELIPLIKVAWADGDMDDKERAAILTAAEAADVRADSAGHQLLENWLHHAPDDQMLTVWQDYITAICDNLDAQAKDHLRRALLDRARQVAEAAGGILGLGNKVSAAEQEMLDKLEAAFA